MEIDTNCEDARATPAVDMDALVDDITEANRHAEVDTGNPVGDESW